MFVFLLCVQLKNYYSTFFGMSQAIAAWMLYFVAVDAYRSVAYLSTERTAVMKKKLKKIPRDIAITAVLIVAFYSAYLPPLRVLLFHAENYAFFMCNVPFENHWDFKINEVTTYIILTHACSQHVGSDEYMDMYCRQKVNLLIDFFMNRNMARLILISL